VVGWQDCVRVGKERCLLHDGDKYTYRTGYMSAFVSHCALVRCTTRSTQTAVFPKCDQSVTGQHYAPIIIP
jgi:hypothetical protein